MSSQRVLDELRCYLTGTDGYSGPFTAITSGVGKHLALGHSLQCILLFSIGLSIGSERSMGESRNRGVIWAAVLVLVLFIESSIDLSEGEVKDASYLNWLSCSKLLPCLCVRAASGPSQLPTSDPTKR